MKRKLWPLALIALLQVPFTLYDIGTPFQLGPPYAQTLTSGCLNNACVNDPCALYPHQSVALPFATSGASPTALLITGVAGQSTYICGYNFSMGGTSPVVMLTTGQASNGGASSTPCATGTTSFTASGWKQTLAIFSSNGGAPGTYNQSPGSGASTLLGPFPPVPTATASVALGTTWDLCVTTCPNGMTCAGGAPNGWISYVQH